MFQFIPFSGGGGGSGSGCDSGLYSFRYGLRMLTWSSSEAFPI